MPLNTEEDIGFLSHEGVCEYAKAYAENFDLASRIRLNAHVTKLEKKDVKWNITYTSGDKEFCDAFDNVMIATGAFAYPRHAEISGKKNFKGVLIHSGQVRNGEPL